MCSRPRRRCGRRSTARTCPGDLRPRRRPRRLSTTRPGAKHDPPRTARAREDGCQMTTRRLLAGGSASAAKPGLSVYFLRGEQVAPVTRSGTTARDAVRALLHGPTRAERERGFRTYVPRGIQIRSLSVARGIATVDLNERFAGGRATGSLLARLAELVRTLTGVQGTKKVQLLLDGSAAVARFPGVNTGKPITFRSLQTPNVPVPEPPPFRLPPPDPEVKALQQRLIQLGY